VFVVLLVNQTPHVLDCPLQILLYICHYSVLANVWMLQTTWPSAYIWIGSSLHIFLVYTDNYTKETVFWICFLSSFKTFQVLYKPDSWSIFLRLVGFIVFNVTFNNISVISWRSVLLVEETGVPGENHWPAACHWQTVSHNVVSSTLAWAGFEITTFVVIGTDCIGSYKSNYHTITTTTAPSSVIETDKESKCFSSKNLYQSLC
jgi:hypothetical protein